MNTIFQDRDITAGALASAPAGAHAHAIAITRGALARAGSGAHQRSPARAGAQEQDGKTGRFCWKSFSIWIQMAEVCQLNSITNQQLSSLEEMSADGKRKILPTELSPCFYSCFTPFEVGGNLPLPTGEIDTRLKVGGAISLERGLAHQSDGLGSTGPRNCILALDLGTTTGFALRTLDGQIAHGFASFKPQRFEGGGMRYLRFKRWLTEIKSLTTDIHAVYFEEIRRHAGVDAAHVYGGLMATLTTWCEHHNIAYQGVPVGTIKKHATGKGNAGKGEVIAAMVKLGHPVTDDNEADALAILHWAIDTQEG